MSTKTIIPIAAFDFDGGKAIPVGSDWPQPDAGERYRWLHFDLNDPSFETWASEHLPQIAVQSLRQKETRPRCENYAEGMVLNLRAVNLNPQSAPEDMVSLRLWVTPKAIVSARLRKIYAVEAIREAAVAGEGPDSVGAFVTHLVYTLVNRIEAVSLELEERTDDFEVLASEGAGPEPDAIGELRQTVLKMRRFINPQREAIAHLSEFDDQFFSERERNQMREINNRIRRTVEELDAVRERLAALQDQMDAARSQAIGRNSYVLSVVAAVFLPLGFLTGLFGVNVGGMPGTEEPMAFWVLSGGTLASGLALYLIFKFAKWL